MGSGSVDFPAHRRCRSACFFFSSRRRHTRFDCDWSSDVCSSDLIDETAAAANGLVVGAVVTAITAGSPADRAGIKVQDVITKVNGQSIDDSHPLKDVDRKSTRLNSSHSQISYAVFCLKKKQTTRYSRRRPYTCATESSTRATSRASYCGRTSSRRRAWASFLVGSNARSATDSTVHCRV